MGLRYDSISIPKNIERTTSGALKIPARFSRTGVQKYLLPNGTWRSEYRPPREVQSTKSLETLAGAPVCTTANHEHPAQINAKNWRQLAVGHVGDAIKPDGDYTTGFVFIQDQRAIDQILSGELVELSTGYSQDLLHTPGVTESGERYDAIQTNIKINHVLLLPRGRGRAGREVGLRLDANDHEIGEKMEITINGVKYSEISETLANEVRKLLAEVDQNRGRADAAEQRAIELEKSLTEARDPSKIDALVNARADFVAKVRKITPEIRLDGRSEHEILVEVCGKTHQLTGSESVDYLRGLLAGQSQVRGDAVSVVEVAVPETHRRVRWEPCALAANRGQ